MKSHQRVKQDNIKRQSDLSARINANVRDKHIMTADLEQELKDLNQSFYITKYKNLHLNNKQRITNSWRNNHEECPTLISNLHELKLRIMDKSLEFDISGDIELDHGYSFAH
jgi:hypothetical protein